MKNLYLKPARMVTGLAALLLSCSLQAQAPAEWWSDIAHDRGRDVSQQLQRGTDPNVMDADNLPSLMLAIRSGAWQAYDALLADKRIQVEVENQHGETPLMYLALLGDTQRVADLIKRGAQVNRLGWTPLHYAASRGQTETADFLLKQGALVHAPAPDGTTPLMMAAFSGNRDTVQLLLNKGADATAVNLNQHTAADWARERRHTNIAAELDEIAARSQARREGRDLPQAQQPAVPAAQPASEGGSRYFDLNRFEDQD